MVAEVATGVDDLGRRGFIRPLLLALITVATLLPFADRAFHIDDPLFLRAAEQIRSHPLDPYGFTVNWYGMPMRMADVTKNPPLVCYYIAAVDAVFGRSERALHLAFFLPAIGVILGTYKLASRLGARPMAASLATLFTPVFLVSAGSVMSDVFLLLFWVGATYLWITGLERGSAARLTLAALAVALAALSKYFGAALIPTLLAYTWVKQRRVSPASAYLLLPVVILAAYQWATHALYGRGLLLDAAGYASRWGGGWERPLIGLSFTGGCLGVPVLLLLWRARHRFRVAGVAAVVAMVVAASVAWTGGLRSHPLRDIALSGGEPWVVAGLFGIFVTAGAGLLVFVIREVIEQRSADALLLGLWILGTYLFAAVINWSVNGRTILPMVPAAAILITRHITPGTARGVMGPRVLAGGLAGAAVLALAVALADAGHADSARRAAGRIHEQYGPRGGRVWFQGHWGFQYYMERHGHGALDVSATPPPAGDIVVVPENNTNLYGFPEGWAREVEVLEVRSSLGVAVMRIGLGAGFYSDLLGPLPYVATRVPPERYRIFEVQEPPAPH